MLRKEHVYIQTNTHTQTNKHRGKTHAQTKLHTDNQTCTHTCTGIHTKMCMHTPMLSHMYTLHVHAYTFMHINMQRNFHIKRLTEEFPWSTVRVATRFRGANVNVVLYFQTGRALQTAFTFQPLLQDGGII